MLKAFMHLTDCTKDATHSFGLYGRRFEKYVSLASDESNIRLDELVIVKLEAKISTHTDNCLYGG